MICELVQVCSTSNEVVKASTSRLTVVWANIEYLAINVTTVLRQSNQLTDVRQWTICQWNTTY